jgi:hypothetical protein
VTADDLRGALADAIRDRQWRSVEIIQQQIDDRERRAVPANVVPLLARRGSTQ